MNSIARAEEYYTLVGQKKEEEIGRYLHPDVEWHGPLAALQGRDAVIKATSNFMKAFHSLTIRATFGAGNQAMLVYDVDIPGISPKFPGASLVEFRDGLIVRIELFYDGSPFTKKREEIFS